MIQLPETPTLLLRLDAGVLEVTLNRPDRRNALSAQMVEDLLLVFTSLGSHAELRAIVLRGAAHTFCAGADVKAMQGPMSDDPVERTQMIARANRRLGDLLLAAEAAALPVVAVVEGAVLGGGIGLVCVSDIALASADARFGLPETGLGLVPAQIAPFVMQRIGLTQARRLMLTGARTSAQEAERLGLVHAVFPDAAALDVALAQTLNEIRRCAPGANASTKRLLFSILNRDLSGSLDHAAQLFAEASVSEEAREGTLAFLEKRPPRWAK
jgi:isohexenylglutaconyl-CoA hydratase